VKNSNASAPEAASHNRVRLTKPLAPPSASCADLSRESLRILGAVTDRQGESTTRRYAHVGSTPARRASDETAAAIAAVLAGPRTSRGVRLTASCGNVPGGLKITNGRSRLFLPPTT